MNPHVILLPAMALVGWTLLVLLLMPYRRFRAVSRGQVTAEDFRYGESARVPADVSIANRNYMNLLEVPILFYVVCVVADMTQHVDGLAVGLAWAFVAMRVVHSLIHLTVNNVWIRMVAFAAGNGLLAVLWLRLFVSLV